VRIGLNLKGIEFQSLPKKFSLQEHRSPEYLAANPLGLIPALDDDGFVLGQSLAILEYLEDRHPEPPLLPQDPRDRAVVRSMSLSIACEIHPLNNLRVLNYLREALGQDEAGVRSWYRHWIGVGFEALEALVRRHSADGTRCFGAAVTLADVCLVPQLANARRFDCDLSAFPTLTAIGSSLARLEAFDRARPEHQPDAE
jgi:maleylacetoacetate isomerase